MVLVFAGHLFRLMDRLAEVSDTFIDPGEGGRSEEEKNGVRSTAVEKEVRDSESIHIRALRE